MRGKKNNKPFVFKQFSVQHNLCAHKVGFDGVLLGAWANFNLNHTILDLGCGCGLIALMAAQQNTIAHITGIETDNSSAEQARFNFASQAQWHSRLQVIHDDFLTFNFEKKFDHIVSNPPYFFEGVKPTLTSRNDARHITRDSFFTLVAKTFPLLQENGTLSLIFPDKVSEIVLSAVNHAGFYIHRLTHVYTSNTQIPERVLLEAVKEPCETLKKDLFVYESNGKYSAEYINLTKAFYLSF